jgi:hypothetical protein
MKAYIIKLGVAALGYLAFHCCIILFLPAPLPAAYWVREMIVVKRHQTSMIPSPKIVFLGGSSVLFGIDATMVENEIHVPTENFGLHAGMRLDWLLAEGERAVTSGDLLVLALEPNFYECGQSTWTQWQLYNALAWKIFLPASLSERINAVVHGGSLDSPYVKIAAYWDSKVVPERVAPRLAAMAPATEIIERYESGRARSERFAYSAYNVDGHGDLQHTEGSRYADEPADVTRPDRICSGVKDSLRSFVAQMRGRGVRVVFEYFPYLIDDVPTSDWVPAAQRFAADINQIGSELIGARDDFFFSRNMFFNTIHHLNGDGRRKATAAIIRHLQKLDIGHADRGAR